MIRIMILEDSEDNLKAITTMVERVSKDIVAVPVRSLEEALGELENAKEPFQAFLLDINLDANNEDDNSGIEVGRQIRLNPQYAFTPIIMITSLANLELDVYRELHCYQYIVKPYNEDDIENLINKILFQRGENSEPFILVKKDGVNYKVFCKNIIYIQAVPRGVNIVMNKSEMKVPYTSIKQLMEKLPKNKFFQCHRMYVINEDHIDYIDMVNGVIKLKNNNEVEIGITYKNDLKKKLLSNQNES